MSRVPDGELWLRVTSKPMSFAGRVLASGHWVPHEHLPDDGIGIRVECTAPDGSMFTALVLMPVTTGAGKDAAGCAVGDSVALEAHTFDTDLMAAAGLAVVRNVVSFVITARAPTPWQN